jgi:hypothetical protein
MYAPYGPDDPNEIDVWMPMHSNAKSNPRKNFVNSKIVDYCGCSCGYRCFDCVSCRTNSRVRSNWAANVGSTNCATIERYF